MNTYTYKIEPFQQVILKEIQSLHPTIYNYVINQKNDRQNLTLKQLKRSIYRSVRFFVKDYLGIKYKDGIENKVVKYYCFFETSKEFNKSQWDVNNIETEIPLGLHFHLFISTSLPEITLNNYTHYLYQELTSFPNKKTSLRKFGYRTYYSLPQEFILYHTKQYKEYPREFIFKNF
jgi:hypothetical protein